MLSWLLLCLLELHGDLHFVVLESLYALIEAFLVLTEAAAAARVVRAVKHLVVDFKFDILHRGFAFALLLAQCLESPAPKTIIYLDRNNTPGIWGHQAID